VGVFLNQYGFESTLKYVADTLMLSIEILRVSAIEELHAFGQSWRIGFNQQMIVIVHQAISSNAKVIRK
jgi:hypothetical protein